MLRAAPDCTAKAALSVLAAGHNVLKTWLAFAQFLATTQ